MKDKALEFQLYGPGPNATNTGVTGIDIGVDMATYPNLSDMWREGKVRITYPAIPSNTTSSNNVTITIYDSADGGQTFQQTPNIQIQAQIPGVASTGSAAGTIDLPLPPALRGPFTISITTPAGVDCSALLFIADWLLE